MKSMLQAAVVAAALVLLPGAAHAEWYVFPFSAVNAGGDTTRESGAVGGSVGWMGKWYGAEGELTWSPSFFDDDDGFRTRHRETTYSASGLVGPRLGVWRPYASAGIGVLRSEIEEVGGLAAVSDDRPAFNVGGGVMWLASRRLGVRGDVRYTRAMDDTEPNGNVFTERFADFSYWRVGAGVAVRW